MKSLCFYYKDRQLKYRYHLSDEVYERIEYYQSLVIANENESLYKQYCDLMYDCKKPLDIVFLYMIK